MLVRTMRLVVLGLCCLVLLAPGANAASRFSSENLFYMLPGNRDSFASFKAHADEISIISPAAYEIDKYGTISGGVDPRVIEIAREHHIMVMPLFQSTDQAAIHEFLGNPAARARAIRIMLYDAETWHFGGWQFDLENVNVADGPAYTDFYRQAADALHRHGLKISMAVVKSDAPVPDPGHSGYDRFLYENWRGAFDLKALAKIGDFLSFMSYDEHTSLTPPGPVAGIPWMRGMAEYLIRSGIDPQKISFGIPTYSDHWYPSYTASQGAHSTRAEISYAEVQYLLDRYQAKPQWMADQGVDFARWTAPDGVFNWLFIENARSFKEKLALIPEYHFRGFSAWVLGDEDPAIWDVLQQETEPRRY